MKKIVVFKLGGPNEMYSAHFEGSLISIHGRSTAEAIGNLLVTFAELIELRLNLSEEAGQNLDEHQHHREYSET